MTSEHDELAYWHYRRFLNFGRARRALPEMAEEFAAYAIEEWLRSKRSNARWLWVDFVRTQLGRDTRKNGDGLGKKCERGRVEVTEAFQIAIPPEPVAERIDGRRLLSQLKGRDRQIVYGLFWEGKTEWEIGLELGITERRVSQLWRAAIPKLRRRYMTDNLDTVDEVLETPGAETTALSETPGAIAEALAAADDTPTALAPPAMEPRNCALEGCGKTFRVLVSSAQKYCSRVCESKITGSKPFGETWRAHRDIDQGMKKRLHDRIRVLRTGGMSHSNIAKTVNAEGLRTATGKQLVTGNIGNICAKLGLAETRPSKRVVEVEAEETEAATPAPRVSSRRLSDSDNLPTLALTILEAGELSDAKKIRMLRAYAELE